MRLHSERTVRLDREHALRHGETPREVYGTRLSARIIPDFSGSKNSGGVARVVFEEAPKPFTTLHRTLLFRALADRRKEEHVAIALLMPLVMKVFYVLRQCMAERRFPKEHHPREAFLL